MDKNTTQTNIFFPSVGYTNAMTFTEAPPCHLHLGSSFFALQQNPLEVSGF